MGPAGEGEREADDQGILDGTFQQQRMFILFYDLTCSLYRSCPPPVSRLTVDVPPASTSSLQRHLTSKWELKILLGPRMRH